jgi:hypothetical protein
MKENISEQRQKLATLREPFMVGAKHHYLLSRNTNKMQLIKI